MGTLGTDLMSVGFPNGDVALTRIDHTNASGNGFIQQVQFKTSSTLNGSGNTAPLVVNISNATVISFDETVIPVTATSDSVVIQDTLIATSVNGTNLSSQINIYPNPSNGEFTVYGLPAGGGELKITNVLGEIVFRKTVNNKKENIDLTEAPSGIYFLNVKTGNGNVIKKIVKE
jgi:hypothetical protein